MNSTSRESSEVGGFRGSDATVRRIHAEGLSKSVKRLSEFPLFSDGWWGVPPSAVIQWYSTYLPKGDRAAGIHTSRCVEPSGYNLTCNSQIGVHLITPNANPRDHPSISSMWTYGPHVTNSQILLLRDQNLVKEYTTFINIGPYGQYGSGSDMTSKLWVL
jgi:hypothetical protein